MVRDAMSDAGTGSRSLGTACAAFRPAGGAAFRLCGFLVAAQPRPWSAAACCRFPTGAACCARIERHAKQASRKARRELAPALQKNRQPEGRPTYLSFLPASNLLKSKPFAGKALVSVLQLPAHQCFTNFLPIGGTHVR